MLYKLKCLCIFVNILFKTKHFIMETTEKKLVKQLKEQTVELKKSYIKNSMDFASKEFERIIKFKKEHKSLSFNDIKANRNKFNQDQKKYDRLPYHLTKHDAKVEEHIEIAEKNANEHYEKSIVKLAMRLIKKELVLENLKMSTEQNIDLGNISTTITDINGKSVTAYTILVIGMVQKPHYRYLIR